MDNSKKSLEMKAWNSNDLDPSRDSEFQSSDGRSNVGIIQGPSSSVPSSSRIGINDLLGAVEAGLRVEEAKAAEARAAETKAVAKAAIAEAKAAIAEARAEAKAAVAEARAEAKAAAEARAAASGEVKARVAAEARVKVAESRAAVAEAKAATEAPSPPSLPTSPNGAQTKSRPGNTRSPSALFRMLVLLSLVITDDPSQSSLADNVTIALGSVIRTSEASFPMGVDQNPGLQYNTALTLFQPVSERDQLPEPNGHNNAKVASTGLVENQLAVDRLLEIFPDKNSKSRQLASEILEYMVHTGYPTSVLSKVSYSDEDGPNKTPGAFNEGVLMVPPRWFSLDDPLERKAHIHGALFALWWMRLGLKCYGDEQPHLSPAHEGNMQPMVKTGIRHLNKAFKKAFKELKKRSSDVSDEKFYKKVQELNVAWNDLLKEGYSPTWEDVHRYLSEIMSLASSSQAHTISYPQLLLLPEDKILSAACPMLALVSGAPPLPDRDLTLR